MRKKLILANFVLSAGVSAAVILCVELLLRIFLPYNFVTIGHRFSRNASIYGWGFNPYEKILTTDPDTGAMYIEPTNNSGWRDKDRIVENKSGSFRILVLGDSNTFGATVPLNKIYTRILEDKLKLEGYNVEVISIGYGHWGTDHELEALRYKGLVFKPNLVILQFCTNDLRENVSLPSASKSALKPFYYSLSADGTLQRSINHSFNIKRFMGMEIEDKLRFFISKSEILKRILGVCLVIRFRKNNSGGYFLDTNSLAKMGKLITLENKEDVLRLLQPYVGKSIKKSVLKAIIEETRNSTYEEDIFRVLEKRWFNQYWSQDRICPRYPELDSLEWKLYFKLMLEAKKIAEVSNARLAILSDNETGQYEWERYWFRISTDEVCKSNYMASTEVIKRFSLENGIFFIDNVNKVTRARNDPHPNIQGNEAMAENIYLFLMRYFKEELSMFRNDSGLITR